MISHKESIPQNEESGDEIRFRSFTFLLNGKSISNFDKDEAIGKFKKLDMEEKTHWFDAALFWILSTENRRKEWEELALIYKSEIFNIIAGRMWAKNFTTWYGNLAWVRDINGDTACIKKTY